MITRRTTRGFTLIEVMIVIAIVAVVLTAGVPMMWKALAKNDLSRAVHDTLEGCKMARDMAILQNRPYDFVVRNRSETESELLVEGAKIRDPSGLAFAGAATATKNPPTLTAAFPRTLGDDVAIELIAVNLQDLMGASEARVRFYPNGTADEFMVIYHHNTVRRTIKVDIITGAAFEVTQ